MTTYASICAALAPNTTIEISGVVTLPAPIDLTHNNVRLVGAGTLVSEPGCPEAIIMRGRRQTVEGLTIWNEHGRGIRAENAGGIYVTRCQINTKGDGLWAKNGAGLWVAGTHFNALGAPYTRAILIGQWDTAFITDTLSEEHHNGLRLGWQGESANVLVPSMTVDRSKVAFQLEPLAGKIVNFRAGTLWAAGQNGGICPVIADESSGTITNCSITDLYATDFQHKLVLRNGAVAGLKVRSETHN